MRVAAEQTNKRLPANQRDGDSVKQNSFRCKPESSLSNLSGGDSTGRATHQRPKKLARKLLAIRVKLGLSQNQLIQKLNVHPTILQGSISGYELGTRVPPLNVLLRYARIAGVCTVDCFRRLNKIMRNILRKAIGCIRVENIQDVNRCFQRCSTDYFNG